MNIQFFIWLTIILSILKGSYEIHHIFHQQNIKLYEKFQRDWNSRKS